MIRHIILGTIIVLLAMLIDPNYSLLKIKLTTSKKYTIPQASWGKKEQNLFYSTTPNFIAVVGNLKSKALIQQVKKGLKTVWSIPVETLAAPSIVPG